MQAYFGDRSLLTAPLSSGLSYCAVAVTTAARCQAEVAATALEGEKEKKKTEKSPRAAWKEIDLTCVACMRAAMIRCSNHV